MTKQKVHIVSLDVPFPADYGGAIDIFYRVKALHKLGFDLTLHVFEYGRGKQAELDKFAKVIYYPRKRSVFQLFGSRPFIVSSRRSKALLANLLHDNSPIIFEGLHTTWYLENEEIQQRLTFVRTHNVEHEYYSGLKKNASFLKRFYFYQEAKNLKRYQTILAKCKHVLAIQSVDAEYLKKFHSNVHILPASIPDITGEFLPVKRYSLFHGNLSVKENESAAIWIIHALKNVIDPTFPLVIAGKNPTKKLQEMCRNEKIELFANPSEKELHKLLQEAQIHVLHTSIAAGVKLKLLACIMSSGQILVNDKMVLGSSLEKFCTIAKDAKEFKIDYIGLQNSVLTREEFAQRAQFIHANFNNEQNCSLIQKIISHENSL